MENKILRSANADIIFFFFFFPKKIDKGDLPLMFDNKLGS